MIFFIRSRLTCARTHTHTSAHSMHNANRIFDFYSCGKVAHKVLEIMYLHTQTLHNVCNNCTQLCSSSSNNSFLFYVNRKHSSVKVLNTLHTFIHFHFHLDGELISTKRWNKVSLEWRSHLKFYMEIKRIGIINTFI